MTAAFNPNPGAVQQRNLAGRYRFTHDGWLGTLVLEASDTADFTGRYHDDRFGGVHEVVARIGVDRPHRVDLLIKEFNWMPEQRFEGWLFTHGQDGLTGRTLWQGTPYGFFARKSVVLNLDSFPGGRVVISDLQGAFRVVQDGVHARLELDEIVADAVVGRYWLDPAEPPLRARARLGGGDVPHAVAVTVYRDDEHDVPVLVIDGLLFSHDKNAVAGSLEWQGERFGCYLVRVR